MENSPGSLKGQFLLAMPGLKDPNFHQTVSIICEHNDEGAVAVVVNRLHVHLSGESIFKELRMEYDPQGSELPIHIGGPVHVGEIFMLHGAPFDWDSCIMVTPTIAMSNTRDIVEAVALGKGPKACILSLGCAGWGPGQLESEIKDNAWLTSPASDEIVFNCPVENRWAEAVRQMGIDPAFLSDTAGHA
jgi:putative transcriptional regulator